MFAHVLHGPLQLRKTFPKSLLNAIETEITQSENSHQGEIRFVVEAALPVATIWRSQSARDRAIEVFSELRVWDTEANCGVLVYVLLADHALEIVADRGIIAKVPQVTWDLLCEKTKQSFAKKDFRNGSFSLIRAITELLQSHFAQDPAKNNPNELPNSPIAR
jgi:uncharacterized membrane protein